MTAPDNFHPDAAALDKAKQFFLDGLAQLEAGRIDDAERGFLSSLEIVPTRTSTLINLAAVQLLQRRPEVALKSAERALEGDRDAVDAWLHRGRALNRLSRHHEALVA